MPSFNWNRLSPLTRQPRPWLLSLAIVGHLWGAGSAAIALELNDTGPEVETLQRQLQAAGVYDAEITGFFGELTQAAVATFQREQGLTVDGVAGAATQAALTSSLATPATAGTTEIGAGDRGPLVAEVQTLLRSAGHYNRPITGYLDEATTTAIQAFQADRGLSADGIAGPQTLAALRDAATPIAAATVTNPDTLRLGATGDRVVALQERLQVLGFYQGAADGVFGDGTDAAVRAFQVSYQLEADGVAGPATRAAIGDAVLAAAQDNGTAAAPMATAPRPAAVVAPASPTTSTAIPVTAPTGAIVSVPPVPTLPALNPTGAVAAPQPTPAGVADLPSSAPPGFGIPAAEELPVEYSVLQLQRHLRSMDLYEGSLDGQLGGQTTEAIEAAQDQYGVSPADFATP